MELDPSRVSEVPMLSPVDDSEEDPFVAVVVIVAFVRFSDEPLIVNTAF